MRIRKGDKVKIIKGKDRSRSGEVSRVLSRQGKVFISGINIYKKHTKPSARGKEGGIIEIQGPLAAENVALICPHCQEKTRVGYDLTEGQGKNRICKKCGGKL